MTSALRVDITPDAFSRAALEAIEATGVDPVEDCERLRRGNVTADELLAELLQGSDGEFEEGWRDYVSALDSWAKRND